MKGKLRSILVFLFLSGMIVWGTPRWVLAADYDLKEITSQVKAALDNRRERFNELQELKQRGIVGENNRGYVELLTEAKAYRDLVDAENADRRLIYKTIVQQNNLADSELEKVEKAFAQVQKEKADPGDKIQDADGNWVTK